MKERPILFSAEMVRAILEGRKTQTRRVMKWQPDYDAIIDVGEIGSSRGVAYIGNSTSGGIRNRAPCPYGQLGDRLLVRETFRVIDQTQPRIAIDYRSDPEEKWNRIGDLLGDGKKWTPSIHRPRWASRILLEITDVRVELVQEISEDDAKAEGAALEFAGAAFAAKHGSLLGRQYRYGFVHLWDSINAARGVGWDVNPWVWVIEFRRIE